MNLPTDEEIAARLEAMRQYHIRETARAYNDHVRRVQLGRALPLRPCA